MIAGIPLGGVLVPVAGVPVSAYVQTRLVTPRRLPIRAVVLHVPAAGGSNVVDTGAPSSGAEALQEHLGRTTRDASFDYAVDADSIAANNDPVRSFTWGARQVNPSTIQIEMSTRGGAIELRTLRNTLALVDTLTAHLGIQRQTPTRGGRIYAGTIPRLFAGQGSGTTLVGVYGHRAAAQDGERGPSDPGDAIFGVLLGGGYEGFDFNADEDRAAWRGRQEELGVAADGIPGAATVAALAARGRPCGIWVPRPIGCGAASEPEPGAVPDWAPWLAALALGLGAAALARRRGLI